MHKFGLCLHTHWTAWSISEQLPQPDAMEWADGNRLLDDVVVLAEGEVDAVLLVLEGPAD